MSEIIETIARAIAGSDLLAYRETGTAEDVLTAIKEAGYAVVPVEPTEAMIEAGIKQSRQCTDEWKASAACLPGHVYRAMIASSGDTGQ